MRLSQTGPAWVTVGAIVALVVLIIAILGLVGAVPFGAMIVFGLIAALAVARLL